MECHSLSCCHLGRMSFTPGLLQRLTVASYSPGPGRYLVPWLNGWRILSGRAPPISTVFGAMWQLLGASAPEKRQCVLVFAIFRPTTASTSANWPAPPRSAASSRCSCLSTRTFRSPAARRIPGGGELPKAYSHTHDPFVALSFAAAATTKILLGTGSLPHPATRPDRDGEMRCESGSVVRTVDSFSASAAVGMSMRWRITERAMKPASS